VGGIEDVAEDDEDGMNAFERAISTDAPEYLKKFRFDLASDELEKLYDHAWHVGALRALVAVGPPTDWHVVTQRFLARLCLSVRLSLHMTSVAEIEEVFALGGRLGPLDPTFKRDLRRLLLSLSDWDAKQLFRMLRNPENMDPVAFLNLVAHEKLAARVVSWSGRHGVNHEFLTHLAAMPGAPAAVRRMVKPRLEPRRRVVTQTWLREAGVERALSRDDLYELVWSEPLFNLCRRFGLSDNGLRKRCKAMNVPTPPQGYWQRLKQGRRVGRIPLPAITGQ